MTNKVKPIINGLLMAMTDGKIYIYCYNEQLKERRYVLNLLKGYTQMIAALYR